MLIPHEATGGETKWKEKGETRRGPVSGIFPCERASCTANFGPGSIASTKLHPLPLKEKGEWLPSPVVWTKRKTRPKATAALPTNTNERLSKLPEVAAAQLVAPGKKKTDERKDTTRVGQSRLEETKGKGTDRQILQNSPPANSR
mmetsp:Transcript_7768/g.15115  ORF Transcript_7768/g.15115 Transcript_7768/m.15115 type:complete len:145 (-) Transcript_7768:1310-1744(-)